VEYSGGMARLVLIIFLGGIFVWFSSDSGVNGVNYEMAREPCRTIIDSVDSVDSVENAHNFPTKDDEYDYWNKVGNCYATLWRFQEALTAFKKAFSAKPTESMSQNISEITGILEESEVERDLRDNYELTRDYGPAKRLTGKTVVAYIFVETSHSNWSALDRQQAISTLEFVQQWYRSEAKRRKVVEPVFVNRSFVVTKDPQLNRWHESLEANMVATPSFRSQRPFEAHITRRLGFDTTSRFVDYLKSEESAKNVMVVFHLNKESRSFAEPCYTNWCNREFTFILQPVKSLHWDYLHNTLAHESLHLVGADDLYNIKSAASYDTNDIMNAGARYLEDSVVGDLTAYAIGWTDLRPETPFEVN